MGDRDAGEPHDAWVARELDDLRAEVNALRNAIDDVDTRVGDRFRQMTSLIVLVAAVAGLVLVILL